jgi:hypothetical protein
MIQTFNRIDNDFNYIKDQLKERIDVVCEEVIHTKFSKYE